MTGGRPRGGELPPLTPPDAVIVNRRWLTKAEVEYAQGADKIMVEHGAVQGTLCHKYESARWHARKLIRYMVDLRMHERWELSQHVEQYGDGWLWTVEYFPGREAR